MGTCLCENRFQVIRPHVDMRVWVCLFLKVAFWETLRPPIFQRFPQTNDTPRDMLSSFDRINKEAIPSNPSFDRSLPSLPNDKPVVYFWPLQRRQRGKLQKTRSASEARPSQGSFVLEPSHAAGRQRGGAAARRACARLCESYAIHPGNQSSAA